MMMLRTSSGSLLCDGLPGREKIFQECAQMNYLSVSEKSLKIVEE